MRLTKAHKLAFCRAVEAALPRPMDRRATADAMLHQAQLESLPPEVMAAWNNPAVQPYMYAQYGFDHGGRWAAKYPALRDSSSRSTVISDVWKCRIREVERLANVEYFDRRYAMRALGYAVADCNTLKQLQERFPELVQFMPTDEAKPKQQTTAVARHYDSSAAMLYINTWLKA